MILYPHQEAGIEWLMQRPRAGLFDDQGLGKTAQAIVAAARLGLQRVLVIAPTVVTHNWQREIQAWSPTSRVQVIRTGRAMVERGPGWVVMPHALVLKDALRAQLADFDLVVLDEAQFFRKPSAQRTRLFFLGADAICRRAPRCWILTGTPMPNNPTELWPMLAGLAPDRLRVEQGSQRLLNYSAFRDRFCVTEPAFRGRGVRVVAAKNVPELRSRLLGFSLRRMKEQVLDLPPIRFGTVALTEEGPRSQALREADERLRGLDGEEMLQAMRDDVEFSTWRRLCAMAKVRPAAALLDAELRSHSRKVVIFCHHRDAVVELRSALHEFGTVAITGGDSPEARFATVNAFQTDARVRVCVAQIVAGGTGVTLTAASDVVFLEQSFVPGENLQAADRCHRIGQSKPVLVRFLSLAGSVDEVVVEVLARKTQMIREVLS